MLRLSLYANAALLIACVVLYAFWQHADAEMARYQASQAKAEVQHGRDLIAERDRLAKWYANLRANLPKVGRKVSGAINAAPSDCSVSEPVFDGLSDGIRAGNAARRAAD